jgi:hypothetical protein
MKRKAIRGDVSWEHIHVTHHKNLKRIYANVKSAIYGSYKSNINRHVDSQLSQFHTAMTGSIYSMRIK